jgi:hypothetical protein
MFQVTGSLKVLPRSGEMFLAPIKWAQNKKQSNPVR